MATQFYIELIIRTHKGPESFAKFFIGDNRDGAYSIFKKLKGTDQADEKDVLHIDFIETVEGLPVNLKMLTCTLDQLAENCKLITRELFKLKNLEVS